MSAQVATIPIARAMTRVAKRRRSGRPPMNVKSSSATRYISARSNSMIERAGASDHSWDSRTQPAKRAIATVATTAAQLRRSNGLLVSSR